MEACIFEKNNYSSFPPMEKRHHTLFFWEKALSYLMEQLVQTLFLESWNHILKSWLNTLNFNF